MTAVHIIHTLVGGAVCTLLALFACSSLLERKPRAALIGTVLVLIAGVTWFGTAILLYDSGLILIIPDICVVILLALFFAPVGKSMALRIGNISERVDERDTMFARIEYIPGTDKYEQYYARQPKYKQLDDSLRELPGLLQPGSRFYDAEAAGRIGEIFQTIGAMTTNVDGEVSRTRVNLEPGRATARMKRMVRELGADDVGIARLNPMFVYSHVGRGPEEWGKPIENNHKFAIVFSFEMDYFRVEEAPFMPAVEESAKQYLKGAQVSISLAGHIRSLGYPARAHISDSNYQIMLPPVAHDAGLGELSRMGYLISPRFGPRIRLGAVTTDLPLVTDHPIAFGVQDFCGKCLKCAVNCPSGAIPKESRIMVRGVEKWQLDIEQCYRYWCLAGTDCAICMKVCPFSHPPTLIHNLVRGGIKRSSFARTVSVWADDLFYGRKATIDNA